jgi:S-methylmethionine-dependent homocysteine/selenocysteine methylase
MSTANRITILDGGMGRELLRIGAPFRQPEWSALALMEGPEYVRQVHDAFIRSGAEVITSNTFAIVPYHIGEQRFAEQGLQLADLAGQLGRQAIEAQTASKVRLAGSLPPAFGAYRPERFIAQEAVRILDPLVQGLAPHVDLWLAETLGSVAEARAAREAIGRDDQRPLWLSFSLLDTDPEAVAAGRKPPVLHSGESIATVVEASVELGASALLFNCSHAAVMEAAILQANALIAAQGEGSKALDLGVYANAFAPHRHDEVEEANGELSALREDLTPDDYLEFARKWRAAGASIIGGCCGIGPEYIAALVAALTAPDTVSA